MKETRRGIPRRTGSHGEVGPARYPPARRDLRPPRERATLAGIPVRWSTFIFAVAVSLPACKKTPKPPAAFTTSCVLSDATGKILQCFEITSDQPRAARESQCNELEAASKKLGDGPCPAAGRVGVCDQGNGRKSSCYGAVQNCQDDCKMTRGTFSH